jgi:hypothetical protein
MSSNKNQTEIHLVGSDWDDQYLLHLAADPTRPERLVVATGEGVILVSSDWSASWVPFGE